MEWQSLEKDKTAATRSMTLPSPAAKMTLLYQSLDSGLKHLRHNENGWVT